MTPLTVSQGRSAACWMRPRSGIMAAAAPSRSLRSACLWPINELFLRIAPDVCRLRRSLVDRPLRQREAGGDVAEHHAYAGPDADAAYLIGRRQLAVGSAQIPNDTQRFVRSRFALLRVEVDEQDQIGGMAAEGG